MSVLAVLIAGGALAWRYQSNLIGAATRWYLERTSEREEQAGSLTRRREILATIHRQLLMPMPPDGMVPELFEFVTLLSSRVATGEISINWAAYLYTSYTRDLIRERPDGTPRRTTEALRRTIDRHVAFFSLQKRPDARGVGVSDLIDGGGDTITLEEIEEAEREGRDLDLR